LEGGKKMLKKRDPAEGRVYQKILVVAAFTFLVLPFVTTFNEFITKIVESFNFVAVIQGVVAPFIVKVVAIILNKINVSATIEGSHLYLVGGWIPLKIYINWNCIGWQSLILLAFTFMTGLQGNYTMRSKLTAILIGIEGTFLVNIVRILISSLLAYYYGFLPAIIFHDYLGTLMTLIWMVVFWYYTFEGILGKVENVLEGEIGSYIEEIKKLGLGSRLQNDNAMVGELDG
jgi:exosortase/archaeosortase family protein